MELIQLPWVFLGNGDVVFIALQSRINCGFRVVVRELKAAQAQQREESIEAASTCSSPSFQHRTALHRALCKILFSFPRGRFPPSSGASWRAKCVCMWVAAGLAHADFAPATSCSSATSASTTACAVAQMGQVGKPVRLNTAKKRKAWFSLGRSVPQPAAVKSQNMLLQLRAEGRREKEERWQRLLGAA